MNRKTFCQTQQVLVLGIAYIGVLGKIGKSRKKLKNTVFEVLEKG